MTQRRMVDLIIVASDRPMLYEALRRMSIGDPDTHVIVDRRRGGTLPPALRRERRSRDIDEALQTTGWALIPGAAKQTAA